jgi:hypothetical protein
MGRLQGSGHEKFRSAVGASRAVGFAVSLLAYARRGRLLTTQAFPVHSADCSRRGLVLEG